MPLVESYRPVKCNRVALGRVHPYLPGNAGYGKFKPMSFARKVWHLIVAVKDGLSLVFLLLFFFALYTVLTARPNAGAVREGALVLDLDGTIVEEKTRTDPIRMLLTGTAPVGEYQSRDLVRALDAAAKDDRIKAVVLDMSRFLGGGQVSVETVGAALDRVRAAKKPVLAWATVYTDDAVMLASHASEVWVDPMGGAYILGPGGNRLYYGDLLTRLGVNAHVFKVGTYKSAVEPYFRDGMSDPARENAAQLYGSLWSDWQANVTKARPKAQIAAITHDPATWLRTANFDSATAAKNAGLVDRLGDRAAFGQRVAQIAGSDDFDKTPGGFARTDLDPWLADNPADDDGEAIGVVTIAGEIVDGDAGPGKAGGDRIAELLDKALDKDLKGLVVRVNSPGGSVMASEVIRRAILRHKAKGIPIAVSMGDVAASGGYWVSTPAQRIFAEPDTITGSIGIFAVVPTFENAAAKWGVHADGVKTTPLSGQPDLVAGFSPEVSALVQGAIEDGYRDFVSRVSQSRKMTPEAVDAIGQGRVWDGGSARQVGLVDQYGGIDDALEWVAQQAKLGKGEWHAEYLGDTSRTSGTLLRRLLFGSGERSAAAPHDLAGVVAVRQQAAFGQLASDLERLTAGTGAQAYCLVCAPLVRNAPEAAARGWLDKLLALVG